MNSINHVAKPDQALPPFRQIAALRHERGESLAEFAAAVGCSSKGRMSEIERGLAGATVAQALRLEELSAGRIDAAALNEDVRAARHGQNIKSAGAVVHKGTAGVPDRDTSGANDEPAFADTRVIVCDVCEQRVDGGRPNACTFVDCPHSQRSGSRDAA